MGWLPPHYDRDTGDSPPATTLVTEVLDLGYFDNADLKYVLGLVVEPNPDDPHHSRNATRRLLDALANAHYDSATVQSGGTFVLIEDVHRPPHFTVHLVQFDFTINGTPIDNAPPLSIDLHTLDHREVLLRMMTDGRVELLHPRTNGLVAEQPCPQELTDAILNLAGRLEANPSN